MAKAATDKRTSPRRRPTQARSRARVADILKAAGVLLGEVGYDGLSTNLIAERADVPVGSIYQFFEGKDGIVAALVEQFQARILKLVGEQLDAASAPAQGPQRPATKPKIAPPARLKAIIGPSLALGKTAHEGTSQSPINPSIA